MNESEVKITRFILENSDIILFNIYHIIFNCLIKFD